MRRRRLPFVVLLLALSTVAHAQTVNQGVGRGPGGRWTVDFAGVAQPVTVGGTVTVTFTQPALVFSSAMIGHVITDTGSTTAVTGNVTVVQPTGSNLHVVVDSAPTTAVTGPLTDAQLRATRVPVDPSGVTSPVSAASLPLPTGAATDASLTITHFVAGTTTAPSQVVLIGGKTADFTPIYLPIPLTAGGQSLKVDLATIGGLTVSRPLQVDASNTTQPVSAVDGTIVTLGALGDSKATATDSTPVSVVSLLKEISFMEQTPASRAVTNAGTFPVQLTGATNNINNISGTVSLPTGAATSTKQSDGTQKNQIVDGAGNVIGSTGNALDVNIKTPATLNSNTASVNNVTVNVGKGIAATGTQRFAVATDSGKGATQTAQMIMATNLDTTLLAANTSRAAFSVCNHSSSPLLLKFGTGATEFSFNVRVRPGACYDNATYNGVVDGFWFAGADNYAMVSEST